MSQLDASDPNTSQMDHDTSPHTDSQVICHDSSRAHDEKSSKSADTIVNNDPTVDRDAAAGSHRIDASESNPDSNEKLVSPDQDKFDNDMSIKMQPASRKFHSHEVEMEENTSVNHGDAPGLCTVLGDSQIEGQPNLGEFLPTQSTYEQTGAKQQGVLLDDAHESNASMDVDLVPTNETEARSTSHIGTQDKQARQYDPSSSDVSDLSNSLNQDSLNGEDKSSESEQVESKIQFNIETLSYELQVGYRILVNMMSASNRCVNKLFLQPVDDNFPETATYYEKIKQPMWMFKMKEKFEMHQYEDITEFMADFRLMIENCYRFNGPDNFVSKKAQKLETMMKQKVALLSKNLRDKLTSAHSASSEDDILTSAGLRRRIRNPNATEDDPSQQLLSQLRKDREIQEKVDRKQKVEDRKAMEQAKLQELQEWEDNLLGDEVRQHIRTMWELPQIGLFVYLCMESLGLEEEVTQYQLERGLAVPRECSDFCRLMTCLLSTPHQRKNLKSFMPYHVWNAKLRVKVDYFYKVLSDKNGNDTQACYKLGLDLRAFKIMGKVNPLHKRQFHELSFLKRVWLLKNYCDFCLETQQYLQKTIEEIEAMRPNDVREVLLGSDGRGYRYLNFPMFTGKDIRIFKHQKHAEPTLENLCMEDWSVETEKPSASSSRCSTPIQQRNCRPAETPSTSLRARALLQAAESKEASPFRDPTKMDSEGAIPSSANNPPCETTENTQAVAKPANPKKRKKNNMFMGKKKRLKSKKIATGVDKNTSLDDSASTGLDDSLMDTDSSTCLADSSTLTVPPEDSSSKNSADCDSLKSPVASNGDSSSVCIKSETVCDGNGEDSSLDAKDSSNGVKSLVDQAKSSTKSEGQKTIDGDGVDVNKVKPDPGVKEEAMNNQKNRHDCGGDVQDGTKNTLPVNCDIINKLDNIKEDVNLNNGVSKNANETEKTDEDSKHSNDIKVDNSGDSMIAEATTTKEDGSVNVKQGSSDDEVNGGSLENAVGKKVDGVKTMSVAGTNCDDGNAPEKSDTADALNSSTANVIGEIKSGQIDTTNSSSTLCSNGDTDVCDVKKPFVQPQGDFTNVSGGSSAVSSNGDSASMSNGEKTERASQVNGERSSEQTDQTNIAQSEGKVSMRDECGAVKEELVCKTEPEDGRQQIEEEESEDEEDLPERGRMELVAESMEEIRQLMHKLSNPEPIKRGKRVYPGVMKPCEEELLANLTRFHDELLKYERSLINARTGMQVRLRKEVDSYVEPKAEDSKGWDSDHSQSTREASEDETEDADEKPELEQVASRKSKRMKAKQQVAATTSLLTSAASKLSAITETNNEDSNDSFELDVSSRGRLRKRRVIPNNTEDTGIKKRRQDALIECSPAAGSSSPWSSGMPVSAPATLSSGAPVVSHPTVIQRQAGQPWPAHILSMIKSGGRQIITTGAPRHPMAGQVLRLVTPGTDGSVRTLQLSAGGKGVQAGPGSVIISPQNLASIRLVSSTGVVTLPRDRLLSAAGSQQLAIKKPSTTSSPAQASHPVIQQLLLNPNRSAAVKPTVSINSNNSVVNQHHQMRIGSLNVVSSSSGGGSGTLPSTAASAGAVRTDTSVTSSSPVVVSQVSSSLSSAGKQVLDLGSLSVTQIQQLMRNQAIQINMSGTESGPTTLLLTTGLQPLGSVGQGAGQPGRILATTVSAVASQLQTGNKQAGTSSLLAMINNKGQRLVTVAGGSASTVVLASPSKHGQILSPAKVVPPSSLQKVNIQLGANVALSSANSALKNALNTCGPVAALGGKILMSSASATSLRPVAPVATQQTSLPTPCIISSMSVPAAGLRPCVSTTVSPVTTPTNALVESLINSGGPLVTANTKEFHQQKGQKIITVPIPLVSAFLPKDKYASNVTVKTLLENRTPKKNEVEKILPENIPPGPSFQQIVSSPSSVALSTNSIKIEPGVTTAASAVVVSMATPLSVNTSLPSSTLECSTSSEVIVPTVNIKVPSPNTLPSVLHNKNGTTIVQSTKVPIAMASEAKAPTNLSTSAAPASSLAAPASLPTTIPRIANILSATPTLSTIQTVQVPSTNMPPTLVNLQQQVAGQQTALHLPQVLQQQPQGVKNVMLKVTPQTGGSGQFVQGFMTSRGLVIPQSALVQQAGKNVILSNVGGAGVNASAAIQTQQPPQTPQAVNKPQAAVATNSAVKYMVVSPLGGATGAQTSTPAAELVKQIAANSAQVVQSSNSGVSPIGPRGPVKPMVTGAPQTPQATATNLMRMSTPASGNLILNNSTATVAPSLSSPVSVIPASLPTVVASVGGVLQGQNVVNNAGGITPQLAAQILALQQQQQQQQNVVLTSGGKQLALGAQQLQQLGVTGVKQQQPAASVAGGNSSVVTLQLQQLGQLFSSLGGVAQLQQQQQQPTVVRLGTPQAQQIVQLGQPVKQLSQQTVSAPSGGGIILQPRPLAVNLQPQQLGVIRVPQVGPAASPAQVEAPAVQGLQNSTSNVAATNFVMSGASPIQLLNNSSVTPMCKLPGGGNIRRVIRADSNNLGNLASPTMMIGASNGAQVILPTSVPGSAGQLLISPAQQANIVSPLKVYNTGAAGTPQPNAAQIMLNKNQLPAGTVLGKPSVIYASQANPAEAKPDVKPAQLLVRHPNGGLLQVQQPAQGIKQENVTNNQQLLIQSVQHQQNAVKPTLINNAGSKTPTLLYKVGEQYFSASGPVAAALSTSQIVPQSSLASAIPSLFASKPDVQLLVPPACIEASDKMLQKNGNIPQNGVTPPNPTTTSTNVAPTQQSNTSTPQPHTGQQQQTINNGTHQTPIASPDTTVGVALNGQAQPTDQNSTTAEGNDSVGMQGQEAVTNSGDAAQQSLSSTRSGSRGDEEEAALNLLTLANQAI